MFDFLLSEVWWMETLSAAVIAAGAAIAAAILTAIISNRKLDKTLAVHEEASKGRRQKLSHGQEDLSKEHFGLSKEIQMGNATLTFLKEERLKEAARQEVLKGQELKVEETALLLRVTNQTIAELRREILELKERNAVLQRENQALRQNIQAQSQSQKPDLEPEL